VAKSVKIRRLCDKYANVSLTFLICACFNILNEFLCVARYSNPVFAVKAVDNDDIEDNDALLLL